MGKNIFWLFIVLIVVGFGYFYFSKPQYQNTETPINKDTVEQETSEITKEIGNKEIIIEGDEFKFNPTSITVEKGEKISLTFKNIGTFPHDFVVDELGIKSSTINPGEEENIEFVAEKSGTFVMYCSVGNHRDQGMEGKVVVE